MTIRFIVLVLLAAALLTACANQSLTDPVPTSGLPRENENAAPPTTEPTLAPQDGEQGAVPPAGQAAQGWIADALGLPVEEIKITSLQETTWTDSCMGLGGPAESCLQAEMPGFRIQVLAAGRLYTLHTNADGTDIRQVPLTGWVTVSQEEAGLAAVDFIAAHTGQAASGIEVVSVEGVDWPDACLGVPIPNAMCAQVITPGYRISLSAGGQTYEVHSDLSASNLALAAQP